MFSTTSPQSTRRGWLTSWEVSRSVSTPWGSTGPGDIEFHPAPPPSDEEGGAGARHHPHCRPLGGGRFFKRSRLAGFQRSVTVYGVYVARSWTRSMPGSTVMITVDVPVAVVTVSRYTPGSTSNRKNPVSSVVDVPANSCVTALNSCTVVSGDGCPLLVTVPLTGSAHFQMF